MMTTKVVAATVGAARKKRVARCGETRVSRHRHRYPSPLPPFPPSLTGPSDVRENGGGKDRESTTTTLSGMAAEAAGT